MSNFLGSLQLPVPDDPFLRPSEQASPFGMQSSHLNRPRTPRLLFWFTWGDIEIILARLTHVVGEQVHAETYQATDKDVSPCPRVRFASQDDVTELVFLRLNLDALAFKVLALHLHRCREGHLVIVGV